jgi:hypothetical protein
LVIQEKFSLRTLLLHWTIELENTKERKTDDMKKVKRIEGVACLRNANFRKWREIWYWKSRAKGK